MPIYEYQCPKCHKKFEEIKSIEKRHDGKCPKCNTKGKLMPSRFSHYWFNPFTTDGEGFTSKYHRPEEIGEMNAELRGR